MYLYTQSGDAEMNKKLTLKVHLLTVSNKSRSYKEYNDLLKFRISSRIYYLQLLIKFRIYFEIVTVN